MLYLIIPPIIIVISVAVLLILISRKVPDTARLELQKQREEKSQEGAGLKAGIFSRAGQLALRFLEKTTQRFKVLTLKFHNMSGKLLESIKEKRKKDVVNHIKEVKEEKITVVREEKEDSEEFDVFVKKISTREIEQKDEISLLEKEEEEKPAKPMISEEVTRPEVPSASRNKLEEVLIERIIARPRDLDAYEELGDLYFEQKNFQDAKNCYRQMLKVNPANRRVKIKMRRIERVIGK